MPTKHSDKHNAKQTDWAEQVLKVFVPQEYLNDFEINHIEELPEEWVMELIKKEDRIPAVLKGKDVVLNGYCNEIDILTHAFSPKDFHRCVRCDRCG